MNIIISMSNTRVIRAMSSYIRILLRYIGLTVAKRLRKLNRNELLYGNKGQIFDWYLINICFIPRSNIQKKTIVVYYLKYTCNMIII